MPPNILCRALHLPALGLLLLPALALADTSATLATAINIPKGPASIEGFGRAYERPRLRAHAKSPTRPRSTRPRTAAPGSTATATRSPTYSRVSPAPGATERTSAMSGSSPTGPTSRRPPSR